MGIIGLPDGFDGMAFMNELLSWGAVGLGVALVVCGFYVAVRAAKAVK